jgi:hypothetical protein
VRIGHRDHEDRAQIIRPLEFADLCERLAQAAAAITPCVHAVAGIKRSGLLPSVYISHRLELPHFTSTEAASYPADRLPHLLLVDTTVWTGETMRRAVKRFVKRGAEVSVLAMFVRAEPLPPVGRLNYLEASYQIMRFWYEEPPWKWRGEAQD